MTAYRAGLLKAFSGFFPDPRLWHHYVAENSTNVTSQQPKSWQDAVSVKRRPWESVLQAPKSAGELEGDRPEIKKKWNCCQRGFRSPEDEEDAADRQRGRSDGEKMKRQEGGGRVLDSRKFQRPGARTNGEEPTWRRGFNELHRDEGEARAERASVRARWYLKQTCV